MPETGDAAADHDQPRVEERDEAGQHLPHPVSTVPDQLNGHRVALAHGETDVLGCESVLLAQQRGQGLGSP